MGHPNEEVIRGGYAAFAAGDIEALRTTYFADDIVWHAPGDSQISGDFKGTDEVLGNFGKLVELTGGSFRVDVHDVLANDEHGVALAHVHAEREGKTIDQNYVHVFHLTSDAKVSESWIHNTDQAAADEFWA